MSELLKLSCNQIVEAENEEEACAYIALKAMFDRLAVFEKTEEGKPKKRKEKLIVNFNIANLYYELSGSLNPNKTDKAKLVKGVNGLIDAGVVDLIDADGKENYVLNVANLFFEKEAFAMMNTEEIRTIFNLKFKQNYSLLRFAVGLFSTINNGSEYEQYKCGYYSFNKMPERTGVEVKSCKNYLKFLEENNIIYVHHSESAKRDEDGKIKNLSNTYGRPCDKKIIDNYYMLRATREGYDFTKTMDSKKRANITRRYKKYVNNRFKGDIIELVKDVIAYNEQPYQQQHPETQKDTSVFDNDLIEKAKEEMSEHWKEVKKEAKQREE